MDKITTESIAKKKKDPARWLNGSMWDFEAFGVDPNKTPQELLNKLSKIGSVDYVISNNEINPRTAQDIYDDLLLLGATQEEINKLRKETAAANITKQCAVKDCHKTPWAYTEGYKQTGFLDISVSLTYLTYCDECWGVSKTSLDAILVRLYDETIKEVEADNKKAKGIAKA